MFISKNSFTQYENEFVAFVSTLGLLFDETPGREVKKDDFRFTMIDLESDVDFMLIYTDKYKNKITRWEYVSVCERYKAIIVND